MLSTPTNKPFNGPSTDLTRLNNPHSAKPKQDPSSHIPLPPLIPSLLSDVPAAASSIFDNPPTSHEGHSNFHLTKPTQHPTSFSIPLLAPVTSLLPVVSSAASAILHHFPTPHEGNNPHSIKPAQPPGLSIPFLSAASSILSDVPGVVSSIFDHSHTHEGHSPHSNKPTQPPALPLPLPSPISSILSNVSSILSSIFDHHSTTHDGSPSETLTSAKEESSSNHRTSSPLSTTRTPPPFIGPKPISTGTHKGPSTSTFKTTTTTKFLPIIPSPHTHQSTVSVHVYSVT